MQINVLNTHRPKFIPVSGGRGGKWGQKVKIAERGYQNKTVFIMSLYTGYPTILEIVLKLTHEKSLTGPLK